PARPRRDLRRLLAQGPRGLGQRRPHHHRHQRQAAALAWRKTRAESRRGSMSRTDYSERRKLSTSCLDRSPRLLKLLMTPFASEPKLECSLMARSRFEVRPSCRKKIRWPRPHSGAVRNSLGPASPWLTPSASPSPMSCTRRSEKRFTGFSLSARIGDLL